jgi:hypothetical protein
MKKAQMTGGKIYFAAKDVFPGAEYMGQFGRQPNLMLCKTERPTLHAI